jgi:thiamine-monophosphate kinase
MNEFEFINKISSIKNNHKPTLGIGDDTAILDNHMLICSDSFIEGVHFSLDYFTIEEAVNKSIIINLSDILAMNGIPLYYLLNISLPKKHLKSLENITNSINKINDAYKIDLIGGDTTSSLKNIFISVTMIGYSDTPIKRNGAQIDDNIYTCGFPGYSSLAMNLLQKKVEKSYFENYIPYHLSPKINFECLSLFKRIKINSMIDISDGLLNDLSHILKQSNVGAKINEELFYDNLDFSFLAKQFNLNPIDLIYNGGEDFFPLFTSPISPKELYQISEELGLEILHIGKITNDNKIINNFSQELIPKGYMHF